MNHYEEWIARAKYNLKLSNPEIDEETIFDELCYLTQQAVEKAFKGLLIYYCGEYELTHNISKLLKALKQYTHS